MASPDIIVIGAGSSGAALAGRLAASRERRVLLLEAGGGNRHPVITAPIAWPFAALAPQFGWGFKAEPEANTGHRDLDLPRGRLLGGTGSVNGMMYSRGQAEDYDGWAAAGLDGWSYADLLPYFRRSETNWRGASAWHGDAGPVRVCPNPRDDRLYDALLGAARELGFAENSDFNGARQAGFGMPDFTVRRARRESSATAYLKLPGVAENLEVKDRVQVTRLIIAGDRAVGVDFVRNGHHETVHAPEIVLCAGVFNSPHILMLSGIGPAQALTAQGIRVAADIPAVGQNLQDHPMLLLAYAAIAPLGFEQRLRLDRLVGSALAWIARRPGFLDEAPLGIQGFVPRDGSGRPDTQFQVSTGSPMSRPWLPGWRQPSPDLFGISILQLDPQGRGSVSLRSSDPLAAPRIHLNFLSNEHDRQAARDMLAFVRRFFATEALRGLVGAPLVPGPDVDEDAVDAFLADTLVSGAHQVGTCAMGTDAATSVVDADLRVHGLRGLRVADASIMPTIVRGNTSVPAMMIGEKAADLVLGRREPMANLPNAQRQPALHVAS